MAGAAEFIDQGYAMYRDPPQKSRAPFGSILRIEQSPRPLVA